MLLIIIVAACQREVHLRGEFQLMAGKIERLVRNYLSRRATPRNRRRRYSYLETELRAKELQTMAFFLIVSYFAILADAVFI